MRRTSGNNEICFEDLEKALAENPETYRHLDLVAFGFPCQDISNANPKGKGLKGKKSSIFFECMRIVRILNPTWLLIENVPRILTINGGKDMFTVLNEMAESGYGWSYRLLDSQYFGVPQRRKRIFIIGCLGRIPPPEILFEQKSSGGDDKKKREIWPRGLCLTSRSGDRQDPTAETLIASTIQSTDHKLRKFEFGENIIASTIQASDYKKIQHGQFGNEGNLIASTTNAGRRGSAGRIWEETHIAEINTDRKGKVAGIARGVDVARGMLIGNGVTVPVAEWIAKRIIKYG